VHQGELFAALVHSFQLGEPEPRVSPHFILRTAGVEVLHAVAAVRISFRQGSLRRMNKDRPSPRRHIGPIANCLFRAELLLFLGDRDTENEYNGLVMTFTRSVAFCASVHFIFAWPRYDELSVLGRWVTVLIASPNFRTTAPFVPRKAVRQAMLRRGEECAMLTDETLPIPPVLRNTLLVHAQTSEENPIFFCGACELVNASLGDCPEEPCLNMVAEVFAGEKPDLKKLPDRLFNVLLPARYVTGIDLGPAVPRASRFGDGMPRITYVPSEAAPPNAMSPDAIQSSIEGKAQVPPLLKFPIWVTYQIGDQQHHLLCCGCEIVPVEVPGRTPDVFLNMAGHPHVGEIPRCVDPFVLGIVLMAVPCKYVTNVMRAHGVRVPESQRCFDGFSGQCHPRRFLMTCSFAAGTGYSFRNQRSKMGWFRQGPTGESCNPPKSRDRGRQCVAPPGLRALFP
jgi:hypothetical protein